jgi:hypothetical protein
MMVNDTEQAVTGKLTLTLEPSKGGEAVARAESGFDIPALGQGSYSIDLPIPPLQGDFQLRAVANAGSSDGPTLSRRNVKLVEPPR